MTRPSPLSRPGPRLESGLGPPLSSVVITYAGHEGADVEAALDGRPPTHVLASSDPTVTDDDTDGHVVGCRWINETSGEEFVAVDVSTGAAVWTSTTAGGGGSLDVTDGTTTVSPTTTLDFDPTYFDVVSPGGGVAGVTFLGSGSTIDIEDEGAAEGAADTIDFTGAGVSVSFAGGTATVDIPGGGASGGTGLRYPLQAAMGTSSSSTTRAVTITAVPTTNIMIVVTANEGTHAVSGIACTNTTFTKIAGTSVGVAPVVEVWKGIVAGGSSGTTVTVTYAGTAFCNAQVMEWTSLAGTLDQSASRNSTTDASSSHPIPIITPTDASAVTITGATCTNNGTTWTQFSGSWLILSRGGSGVTLGVAYGFPGTFPVFGVFTGGSNASASGITVSLT